MTVKNLFTLDAIVLLAFGLPLIFNPQFLSNLLFAEPTLTAGVVITFRSYGIILSSLAIGLLYGRNAPPSPIRKGFVVFIAVAATLIAIDTIYAIVRGIESGYGWGVVIPTVVLSIWAIALLLKGE